MVSEMQLTDHNRERSSGVIPERYNSASLTRSLAPKLQNPLHVPGQVRFRMGYDGWKPWGTAVNDADRPVRNPHVVLREEFDDWAVLFDPDTGRGFGLSPTGVYVWKLLDGEHTHDAIVQKIREHENVPEDASDHIKAFVDALLAEGMAGFDRTRFGLPDTADRPGNSSSSPSAAVSEVQPFTYQPPRLVDLNGSPAYGDDCNDGSHAANSCHNGPVP